MEEKKRIVADILHSTSCILYFAFRQQMFLLRSAPLNMTDTTI
jgi:hypothetical protein